ncbi:hypothetical protein [Algibacter sp. 2305UL17-15]|uniref:hypothetical protein n=1 Tax=Algibacter sp. 2305UL17-15 TaxID=3231268 RepID=UPI003457F20B
MFGISKDKSFKRKYEDKTSSMVSLAFEYVNNDKENIDAIYIYGSNEEGFVYYDCFFNINHVLLERHRINDTGLNFDISDQMQLKFIKYANQDLKGLIELFKKYKKDIPTQIKMEYYPKTGKFDCFLDYDIHYSNKSDGTPDEVAESWFKELKLKIEPRSR